MKNSKPKIVVVMGPTASGKSGVAIELAKKFNGEIISADSRQVYRGMDIGTGKVTGSQKPVILSEMSPLENGRMKSKDLSNKLNSLYYSEGIVHHLIDVAEPMEDFNVSHFKIQAGKAIEDILQRKKVPIICGGTNFWIDAITKNTQIPEVAPDEVLRSMLRNTSAEELFEQLEKIDPERAENIDSKNKVRLIRALEICSVLGKVPRIKTTPCHSGLDPESSKSHQLVNNLDSRFYHKGTSFGRTGNDNNEELCNNKYDFLQIGIKTEREKLNEKIKKRLDERFDECMIEEVQNLNKNGVSWEWMERIGLEYRWISRFLQDQVSEKEMREKLYFDIIHYAKRQMTWLKRNKEIIWLKDYQDIEKEVAKFIIEKI